MSHLLVAAIDFGTTYSGWAFSFLHEFQTDPLIVSARQWSGLQALSMKAPTCALIKPDGKTLDSFGYDAESKYAELVEDDCHKEWYFFKRFKMKLFGQIGIKRDIEIEDASGKKFSAKKVFSLCIGYLRNDLMSVSKQRLVNGAITVRDIQWVLTVPAIWNDAAKQFMREAAEAPEAGIPKGKLIIALEPEAASVFCRHLPVDQLLGDGNKVASFNAETKYIVLDAGGGTVDITVHQVTKSGNLQELHKASGGAWGGTKVDDAFNTFLTKLFGGPVMAKFQENHLDSYIDIFRSFEFKKRDINPSKGGTIRFQVPLSLIELLKEITGKTFSEVVQQTEYATQVKMTSDKLIVNSDIIKALFDETTKSIIDHLSCLLDLPQVFGCSTIVMVGGFSESPMLQDRVRKKFPNLKLVIPREAGLAVLKGAVIYGHKPSTIAERVCKYTYGTDVSHLKTALCCHPPVETFTDILGNVMCKDIFSTHVQMGQTVSVGEEQEEQIYCPSRGYQTSIGCDIYASSSSNPAVVTESGCNKIGSFSVQLPLAEGGATRSVGMSMKFGGTEIEVKVVNKVTGEVTMKTVDFLG